MHEMSHTKSLHKFCQSCILNPLYIMGLAFFLLWCRVSASGCFWVRESLLQQAAGRNCCVQHVEGRQIVEHSHSLTKQRAASCHGRVIGQLLLSTHIADIIVACLWVIWVCLNFPHILLSIFSRREAAVERSAAIFGPAWEWDSTVLAPQLLQGWGF